MKEPDVPRRRHLLVIKIEGDTVDDVMHRLDDLSMYIERERKGCEPGLDMVSGGVSANTIAIWAEDPEMNAERYCTALEQWRAWRLPVVVEASEGGDR